MNDTARATPPRVRGTAARAARPLNSDQTAVPADADDFADHGTGADRRVARGVGVPSKLKEALHATRGHADDTVREHAFAMTAQQDVPADNVVGDHRRQW